MGQQTYLSKFKMIIGFLLSLGIPLSLIAGNDDQNAPVVKYQNELYAVYNSEARDVLLQKASIIEDYESFLAVEMSDEDYLDFAKQGYLIERLNRHSLRLGSGHVLDTRRPEPTIPSELTRSWGKPGFYIVQFYAPTRNEWLDEITKLGAKQIYSAYFPNFAYLFWVPTSKVLQRISQTSFVNWVGVYQPAYKTPAADNGVPELGKRDEVLKLIVKVLDDESAKRVATNLAITPAKVSSVNVAGHYLSLPYLVVEAKGSELNNVLRLAHVWWVEEIIPVEITSRVARELHQKGVADGCSGTLSEVPVWNAGITGAGLAPACGTTAGTEQLIGIIDTSFNNPDFECGSGIPNCTIYKFIEYNSNNGCNINNTKTSCVGGNGHGSGSAGVMLGNASQQGGEAPIESCRDKGAAFGSRLWAVKCDQGSGDLNCINACHADGGVTTLRNFFQASYANGSRLSNHSWGGGNNGAYSNLSEVVDTWSYDNDNNSANGSLQEYLWFFAAGNSGPGSNTIGSPATAKNDVSGAAVYNGLDGVCWPGDSSPCNENKIVIYSGRGPTDDGRYGPEVAGASQNVTAPANGSGYQEFNGTSCGTPSVTALGALIRDWLKKVHGISNPSGNLVKALLLNSGDYITSPGGNLPAPSQGWGRPNLTNLCDNFANASCTTRKSQWQEGTFSATGQSTSLTLNLQSGTSPLRCMATWMDPPNLAGGGALKNNLNLKVTAPNGTFYNGNDFTGAWSDANGTTFDSANNSEGVRVQTPSAGIYTVQITAANITQSPQPWAVACSGNFVSCSPPATPVLVSPNPGATNQPNSTPLDWQPVSGATQYEVQVDNNSDFGSPERSLRVPLTRWNVLPPLNNSTTYHWRVRAINSCGTGSWSSSRSFTVGTPGAPIFSDVPNGYWAKAFIEAAYQSGMSESCAPNLFCPEDPTLRKVAARWLLKAKEGTGYTPPACTGIFYDVPCSDPYATYIEEFYRRGITAGCGTDPQGRLLFCPNSPVTRNQIAVLLVRTQENSGYAPPAATGIFTDVPKTDIYAPWIEEFFRRGVTSGCNASPPQYCPAQNVKRSEMSVFLSVGFGLLPVCSSGGNTLCLQNRFLVRTTWFNSSNNATGIALIRPPAQPFVLESGFFHFGDSTNIEVGVKVLDGQPVNGHWWTFHGSLTSLQYLLTVTDTFASLSKTYLKATNSFCGSADTGTFGLQEDLMQLLEEEIRTENPVSEEAPQAPAACTPTATSVCLLNNQFRVEVKRGGIAQPATAITNKSGAFTFFTPGNAEVVAKVLDGRQVNGYFWVFFGSLTSLTDYQVVVTNTANNQVKTYASPGPHCGLADTAAFQ